MFVMQQSPGHHCMQESHFACKLCLVPHRKIPTYLCRYSTLHRLVWIGWIIALYYLVLDCDSKKKEKSSTLAFLHVSVLIELTYIF